MEKVFIILSRIAIATSFFSCTASPKESEVSSENKIIKSSIIHIQFVDEPVFKNMMNTKTKQGRGRLEYITFYENQNLESFRFSEVVKNKSLTYSTQSEFVMLRRYFNFFEFQDFLVHRGDSIVMSFDHKKPLIIKNKSVDYLQNNLHVEALINKKNTESYLISGMSDDTRSVAFKYFFDDPNESKRQQARKGHEKGLYLEELENKMASELLTSMANLNKECQSILDSLYNHQEISMEVYAFYKQKYSNLYLKLKIMSGLIDSTQAANELNSRVNEVRTPNEYFRQCLDNYEKKYITSNVKWSESNNFYFRDPEQSFIFASQSSLLSQKAKNLLLLNSLNKVDLYVPNKTEKYLNIFINSTLDTNLIHLAQAKYSKDKLLATTPSDLYLQSFNRDQSTIEELIKQKKGKVLYFDFWASWCAPCIDEMQYSKNILQDYKNKNLEVVFFSLDENSMKWSKAAERLGINLTYNSFKILDPSDSKFMKEHKLKSIPRYMIIDKNGKIINADAPRPSDPKIKKMLNEVLEL